MAFSHLEDPAVDLGRGQLAIVALVSRYLTNKLIGRGLILGRRPKLPFLTAP